jgi:multisubunit Na+/H+ antiporter MnhF subunit
LGAYVGTVALGRFIRRVRGSTVLIIADDPIAREVYCELFAMRGHHVEAASCARAGLVRLAQRPDVAVVVVALNAIAAVAPRIRVHALGLMPSYCDVTVPARQQLH